MKDPGPHKADFERPGGLLSQIDGHLVMYHEPRSVHAEQYRACRTNLTAMNRGGAPWVLLVTSSRAGEGKSVTAANLAMCMAELPGARVCLVDTDVRNPGQAGIFGVGGTAGVTEMVQNRTSFKDAVHRTIIPGLDLITAGAEPDSPSEMLGSQRFQDLLDELRRRYSWIIVDTPPVHPFTDACVLSPAVDGVLVVVRLQETPRDLVNRTIDGVSAAGGKVLGTFLTGSTREKDEYERHGYYHVPTGEGLSWREELRRRRRRKAVERRLRKQEKAYLRRENKGPSRGDDGPPV